MTEIIKKYNKGDMVIIWQPAKCIHSKICFRGLPGVFNPSLRPWVKPDSASPEEIIRQINKCPSGALSFKRIQIPKRGIENKKL